MTLTSWLRPLSWLAAALATAAVAVVLAAYTVTVPTWIQFALFGAALPVFGAAVLATVRAAPGAKPALMPLIGRLPKPVAAVAAVAFVGMWLLVLSAGGHLRDGNPAINAAGRYVLASHGTETVVSRARYQAAQRASTQMFSGISAGLLIGAAVVAAGAARARRDDEPVAATA